MKWGMEGGREGGRREGGSFFLNNLFTNDKRDSSFLIL